MTGSKRKLIACLMLISMTQTLLGCVSAGSDVWCRTNDPRRPTETEYAAMDRESREQMRTHNTYGQMACGWRP